MKNLKLNQWAALAEIIASIAVVVSLAFLVVSINQNTTERAATNINDLYDSIREIEMTVLADAELSEIIRQVEQGNYEQLNDAQAYRYLAYVTQHLSIWEQIHARFMDGSVAANDYRLWKEYFHNFFLVMLPEALWYQRRTWFNDPDFQSEVDEMFENN